MLCGDGHPNVHAIHFAAIAVGSEAVVQVLAALADPVTLALGQIHLLHAPALGTRFGGIPSSLVRALIGARIFSNALALGL